ncbi:MAG TPA: hypothetical protein VHS33_03615 [Sphingomicrobium sp.]|nr:hypothetical protein [Sphingomicrobium sp.]
MAKNKKKKSDKKDAPKATDSIKALAKNPLVADVVAAALVATASALKDSRRARALASEAGDELAKLSKAGARQGEALWDMALQIARRSLVALNTEDTPKPSKPKKSKAKPASKPRSTAKKAAKKKPARAGKK